MNSLIHKFAALALTGWASAAVFAGSGIPTSSAPTIVSVLLAQNLPGNSDSSYNSPTRRANPNSMQGTQPSAPAIKGPNTVPLPRPPTLENGGIGNGYPRSGSQPGMVAPRPEPATPPRDSSDSGQR